MRFSYHSLQIVFCCVLLTLAARSSATRPSDLLLDGVSQPDRGTTEDSATENGDQAEFNKVMGGSWEGLGRGAESIFGKVRISPEKIEWNRNADRRCATKFKLLSFRRESKLPDYFYTPRSYTAGTMFDVAKIEIVSSKCAAVAKFLEFAKPSTRDVLELIASDKQEKTIGYMLFARYSESQN